MGGIVNDVVKIGTLGLVDDVTGSEAAARANNRAVDSQLQSVRESNQLLERIYNQQRADQLPGLQAGYTAQNALLNLYGLPQVKGVIGAVQNSDPNIVPAKPAAQSNSFFGRVANQINSQAAAPNAQAAVPNKALIPNSSFILPEFSGTAAQQLAADPSYQFRLNQGQQALERSAAARGGLYSGGFSKDLTDYAQGAASQEFSNIANRLSGLAGLGPTTAQSIGNAATNYGNQASQNIIGGGNARASGYINAGNQRANDFNSLLQLGGLGAAIFSDRRLKSNIKRIGTHASGLPWYSYDIFGQKSEGVMADEVMAVKPEAVTESDSGYLMVDYGAL